MALAYDQDYDEQPEPQAENLLDVADLVQMFEDAESSSYEARKLAERDRDYVDNKQLTDAERKILSERGQPEVVINRIKRKVDFLVGMEKKQRVDPRALPRTPAHEDDAAAAGQSLRYVADVESFDAKRSSVWRNMLVEGAGGVSVTAEQRRGGIEIAIHRWPWDRLFWDPHSSEEDFSDAGYVGGVIWMDYDDAIAKYRDNEDAHEILETTLSRVSISDTYDDKPKWGVWADSKRRRVRIAQIWVKRDEQWYFAEFTKGGILRGGPSPYMNDQGESECEMILQSAYVDRDNNRYGIVREMISPQDEVNKRRSKSLHLLNTTQIVYEEDAISPDVGIEKLRKEAARPDGVLKLAPGGTDKFRFNTRTDLAAAHLQMMQEAKAEIDLMGPNATMGGDNAGSASGRAIIASQQGGMVEIGDLMDNLRQFDKRVFRAVWARIRQFWTAEKWVRVTDDEKNIRWLGINVDPMQIEMLRQQNPEAAEKIAGSIGNVAELDCDIIIDDGPDGITLAGEQWDGLVKLAAAGVQIPPDVIIEAAPALKSEVKQKLLAKLNEPNPAQQASMQVQVRGAAAKVRETEANAAYKEAQAVQIGVDTKLAPLELQRKGMADRAKSAPVMEPVMEPSMTEPPLAEAMGQPGVINQPGMV